ncbi:glutamyl-tRNA reductase [Streptomyces aidingensis]|uniref:Glutamyl-tRNA reductase n=1 Tax=Streptomyces aidingensis TaxID=910347 RepID=A0A1I1VC81_9ACTN|nr:glutamyl-tRNA reductase [Streptomyces aidingensis]SFD80524.1 glutamyl-tRNA reductase [Streptomyces aidingensis]
MSLLVVGLSHRSAPVSVLERAALAPEARGKLLRDLVEVSDGDGALEAAVLSTCNRIEVYAAVGRFHDGVAECTRLLARHSGVRADELTPYLYVHYEDRAVHHLFSVACGLDSMVVGEGQILGQIKDALALAQDENTAGRLLNELFQQALRVGKRAHTETGIDRAGQSLVTFGLRQLAAAPGGPARAGGDGAGRGDGEPGGWPAGRRALVIGAGSMSSLAAATLARAGVAELVIANRTVERAERLAENLAGIWGADGGAPAGEHRLRPVRAVPINAISVAAELAVADLVVSCTGATGLVLTTEAVRGAVERRPAGRPLALLDLAMPRDVDAGVHRLTGARLVDIESLAEASADAPLAADVEAARGIVAEEVAAFRAAQRAAHITPTVVALRTMASGVVAGELARLEGRLPGLDDKQRAEIAQTVRRVVDKLLHAPTVRVKELAGEPGGADYAHALRELFNLDPQRVAAVSRPEHGEPGGGRPPAARDRSAAEAERGRRS